MVKNMTLIIKIVDLKGQMVIAGKMFPFSEVSVECSRVVPPCLIVNVNENVNEL